MGLDTASASSAARFGVAIAAFSAATFGFGTTFARLAYDGGGNPLTVVLLRLAAFVVVVGLVVLLLRRRGRLSRRGFLASLWMAATLGMVSVGYQGAVAFIPVSLAALLFYTFPLLVGVVAVIARRDRMTAGKALALIVAFLGLALALGPAFTSLDWRGIVLAMIAALGMTLTLTFGGGAMRDEDAVAMGIYTNLWMLVALSLVAAATEGLVLPATPLGAVGALGACASYVVAYLCWYFALTLVKPVRLAAVFNIEPVVTLIAASLILGERLSGQQLVGAALVLLTILSATGARAARESLGRPLFAHLVVLRAVVEAPEDGACRRRDDSRFVIRAGERLDGVKRRKPHNGDELDLLTGRSAEELDLDKPRDVPAENARKNLGSDEGLVGVRVLQRCPAMPQPSDHGGRPAYRPLAASSIAWPV